MHLAEALHNHTDVGLGPTVQSHPTFIVHGFQSWKRIGRNKCSFQHHVGKLNSPHHLAMQKWSTLKNSSLHIEKVVDKQ